MSPTIELRILKSNLQQHAACKTEVERLKDEVEPQIREIFKEWRKFQRNHLDLDFRSVYDIDDFELMDNHLNVEGEESCMGLWEPWSENIPRDFIFDRENAVKRLKEEHEEHVKNSKLAAKALIEKKKQDELDAEKQQYLKLKAKFEVEENAED